MAAEPRHGDSIPTVPDVEFESRVMAAAPDLLYVMDRETGAGVWCSSAAVRVLGRSPEELIGMGNRLADLVHPEDRDRVRAATLAAGSLLDGQTLPLRSRVRHADGSYRWLAARLAPFSRGTDALAPQVLGSARDVTGNVAVEEQLALAALHDPLTGLPNRALLTDRLGTALQRHVRNGEVVPVLFCDLDGFKHVNDTSGHQAGDKVLIETAQRLRNALRPQDTVARVGGDEFVIVLETASNAEQRITLDAGHAPAGNGPTTAGSWDVRTGALAIADRLIAALGEPIEGDQTGDQRTQVVTASIGVTFARPGSKPEEALRDADSAMYRAKARGKNRLEVFDDSFRAEAVERGHIEHALRLGLVAPGQQATPGLSVVYQPVFDLAGPHLVGVEALARLTDSAGLSLAPDDFIPIAEETGLIAPLGRMVLDIACRDLAGWHARHPAWRHLGVAVNLSARQAGLADLVADVRVALQRTGLAPGLLTLELTESVLLEAGRSTLRALTALTADGVRLAIDDFGTGYASLRYLAQLPVTCVKIDRSFTAGLPEDPTCVAIVRTVAGLARDLGIACVVEGIETNAQLRALPAGVHGQGYLLGRPVAAHDLDVLLGGPRAEHDQCWPDHLRRIRTRRARWDADPRGAPAGPGDRPVASDGADDPRPRHTAADARDRRADVRDQVADRRDEVAGVRDQRAGEYEVDVEALLALAERRDSAAAMRDRSAYHRDLQAAQREEGAAVPDPAPAQDRRRSALDRVKGSQDRDAGAVDRDELSASGQSRAWQELASTTAREAAAADRAAATRERDAAESPAADAPGPTAVTRPDRRG